MSTDGSPQQRPSYSCSSPNNATGSLISAMPPDDSPVAGSFDMPEELTAGELVKPITDPGLGSTLGEFIVGTVRKELWTTDVRRQRQHGSVNFMNECPGEDLLKRMELSLAQNILDAATGWIPALRGLTPASLMPDLYCFPHKVQDVEGLTPMQRKLLLQLLEIVLDDFHRPPDLPSDTHQQEDESRLPLLLPVSIACISAQIAAALEHVVLTNIKSAPAQLREADMDLNHWQQVAAKKTVTHSREELLEELQKYRQESFDLEAKMQSLTSTHERILVIERSDAKQALERLLTINSRLETKLRTRTEESREKSRQISELHTKLDYARWLTEKTSAKRDELERESMRWQQLKEDMFIREREYGRRLIRFRVEEVQTILRNNQRAKQMRDLLDGNPAASVVNVDTGEPGQELGRIAKQTIMDLERAFDELLAQRQEQFQEMVMRKERCFQRHFGELVPELCRGEPGFIAPETASHATQTDRWLLEGCTLPTDDSDASPTDGEEATLPDSPTSVEFADTPIGSPRGGAKEEKHRWQHRPSLCKMVKHNKPLDTDALMPVRKSISVSRMMEAPGRFIRKVNDEASLKRRATCLPADARKGFQKRGMSALPTIADSRRTSEAATPPLQDNLSVEFEGSHSPNTEEEEEPEVLEEQAPPGTKSILTSTVGEDHEEGLEASLHGAAFAPEPQSQLQPPKPQPRAHDLSRHTLEASASYSTEGPRMLPLLLHKALAVPPGDDPSRPRSRRESV